MDIDNYNTILLKGKRRGGAAALRIDFRFFRCYIMSMEGEQKRSGWRIWLYLTPVYILIAVPLFKWTMKLNSGDVRMSGEDYGAFNATEGEVKKAAHEQYDPGLTDIGYTVRYRSAKDGQEEGAIRAGGASGEEAGAGAAQEEDARPQKSGAQYRAQSAQQTGLQSSDTANKSQMSFGAQKGYLTYAVGKAMNNPKAVAALMNNSWVVKGFLGRDTTKSALGSEKGLQNYLSNPKNVSNFLGNPVVQAAMNNPAVINAFASSAMANSMLSSPAVQSLLQNPQAVMQMMATNPQMMQALSNPNVMNALMNNPQTAGLAASLGGAKR